jgi:hypothetical protein
LGDLGLESLLPWDPYQTGYEGDHIPPWHRSWGRHGSFGSQQRGPNLRTWTDSIFCEGWRQVGEELLNSVQYQSWDNSERRAKAECYRSSSGEPHFLIPKPLGDFLPQ